MEKIVKLESLFHRSKKRIKDLGEVFTPDRYVEDMLDLISDGKRRFWCDEKNVFFEPCCGHGNIVVSIYKRRLESIYKNNFKEYLRDAALYAVSNSINTLWAIDIDEKNIESCRTRILFESILFIKNKLNYQCEIELLEDYQEYFVQVLCAIKWHIYQNEALSALDSNKKIERKYLRIKATNKWIRENGTQEMNFKETWAFFYNECEKEELIPLEYEKAKSFYNAMLMNKKKNNDDFEFAAIMYQYHSMKSIRKVS